MALLEKEFGPVEGAKPKLTIVKDLVHAKAAARGVRRSSPRACSKPGASRRADDTTAKHTEENMKRWWLVPALVLACGGCATSAKYKAVLDSWVGSPVQSLVDSWGYPAQQMVSPAGNQVYVYQRSGSFVVPATSTTYATVSGYGNTAYGQATTTTYGGNTVNLNCATYFEIGPGQTIISWRFQGNNCVSR